jgi:hypothetical protein
MKNLSNITMAEHETWVKETVHNTCFKDSVSFILIEGCLYLIGVLLVLGYIFFAV